MMGYAFRYESGKCSTWYIHFNEWNGGDVPVFSVSTLGPSSPSRYLFFSRSVPTNLRSYRII